MGTLPVIAAIEEAYDYVQAMLDSQEVPSAVVLDCMRSLAAVLDALQREATQ